MINDGDKLGLPACFVYDIKRSILILENLPRAAAPSDWCLYFKQHMSRNAPVMKARLIEEAAPGNVLDDFKYVTQVAANCRDKKSLFRQGTARFEVFDHTHAYVP